MSERGSVRQQHRISPETDSIRRFSWCPAPLSAGIVQHSDSGKTLTFHISLWVTMVTTIRLRPETKSRLDALKTHPRESYDETLNRLLDMAYDPEPLSEEKL